MLPSSPLSTGPALNSATSMMSDGPPGEMFSIRYLEDLINDLKEDDLSPFLPKAPPTASRTDNWMNDALDKAGERTEAFLYPAIKILLYTHAKLKEKDDEKGSIADAILFVSKALKDARSERIKGRFGFRAAAQMKESAATSLLPHMQSEKNGKKFEEHELLGKEKSLYGETKSRRNHLEKTGVFNPFEHQSQEAQQAFSEMIKKQLETNIIKPIQEKDVKHLNPVFAIRKKDGGWRQIVDCRRLNNAIKTIYNKQEDHRTVEKIIQENDYAVTIDLSQAYYLIKVSEELSPFLSFVFKGKYCAFHGMPIGYKDAPRTFTKVMKKVQKYMREEWNVRAIAYLYDIVLLHQDPRELNIIVEKTLTMFNKLGLLVNSEKCHLIQSQQFKFLGFQWDTNQFVVQIEESKKTELMKEFQKWRMIAQHIRVVLIKKLALSILKLNATRFVYQEASLNLSQLYKLLNKALSLNGWKGKMRVNA
ncbi:putative Reverse transcriptase (RNA-dependent DNA polymerase) [Monocercomonoides exilis]|uniref:putative Reverse transcriptase (RNA-dependent DNA polymerase) n=1 Tax=Monocercomonoides exilis TaxID=2049356 RepID=UPI00355A5B17|nr:putative Reverse transcriptase (RNA-dependent DNA polymerase) [Monocercomonoides exilis]|eukprot:MONOS_8422.1-p1 / transcript=MONOS_8422.1 / gene=MONOS_8422 / organism=Monocercomonoides_exilis_PA203 / gene_product=unspecified product / transcript_product=unspecified product / location=Mono_scaffold00317:8119-10023(-) / protein_length=476 / sequence_SO=supercontig / SO=protein_coding / is_pseudo=false